MGCGKPRQDMGCKQRHAHSMSGHGEAYSFMMRGEVGLGSVSQGAAGLGMVRFGMGYCVAGRRFYEPPSRCGVGPATGRFPCCMEGRAARRAKQGAH